MLCASSAKSDTNYKITDAFQNAPFYHPAAVILYPTSNPVLTATGATSRRGVSRGTTYSAATATAEYQAIPAKPAFLIVQTIICQPHAEPARTVIPWLTTNV